MYVVKLTRVYEIDDEIVRQRAFERSLDYYEPTMKEMEDAAVDLANDYMSDEIEFFADNITNFVSAEVYRK